MLAASMMSSCRLAILSVLCVSACARAVPAAGVWKATLEGPSYVWCEPDGRWVVEFHWRLHNEGAAPTYLSGASQSVRMTAANTMLQSIPFSGTLSSRDGEWPVVLAMFHQDKAGPQPVGIVAELGVDGVPVARWPLDPSAVATQGLQLTLGGPAKLGHYHGHRQEGDSETLGFDVTVMNPTTAPVRFSPFELAGSSGGVDWHHHHGGSHQTLMLLDAGATEHVHEELASIAGTRADSTVVVRYGKDVIGSIAVSP
jgi:hypothetical protein